mmetsp:Transcript_63939/g.197956  ORF Transcript_63939/g.197956 Transcript_63939/m.197956 type:complete len:326 (+) Transcript_63939:75-1052(+)
MVAATIDMLNPPMVARKPVPTVMHPSRPVVATGASGKPGLELRADGLPEGILAAGGSHRRLGCKTRCAQFWVRAFGLPLLLEEDVENPGAVDSEPLDLEQAWQEWQCLACTFVNHGLMLTCEVCGTRRAAPSADKPPGALVVDPGVRELAAAAVDGWPSLRRAVPPKDDQLSPRAASDPWEHCEVSSSGSSWLDVEGAACFTEIDLDLEAGELDGGSRAVLVGAATAGTGREEPPAPLARGAAPAGAAVEPGATAEVSVGGAGTRQPPARPPRPEEAHRSTSAQGAQEDGEERGGPDSQDLEARRTFPCASRGTPERRDVARRRR